LQHPPFPLADELPAAASDGAKLRASLLGALPAQARPENLIRQASGI
jgi:hypothetical protein